MATVTPAVPLLGGLVAPDPGRETYLVGPGGATAIALGGDDRVRIVDRHGGQVAELTAVGADGRDDAEALGVRADAPATVVRGLLRSGTDGFLEQLRLREPDEARAARLFGPDSPPGEDVTLVAERDTTVVVAAPGGRVIDGDRPGSELLVEVRRAVPRARFELELPPPLAEPRLDFRVDAATASSYEVRAGEYIQIIDVRGRQCSDFLAFHRRKLEDGRERGLDATVTRTLMGNAYPMPGLYAKFLDLDMDPLCEVVRDTVGRHDSFALACQAKYYEDLGYPGHVNCTDNFNAALTPYPIAPRKGWAALNFFYNTAFDSSQLMFADEPWSRPGDYVLLRASTDLVCASSACPDDIDPSNGWEVTDVHVRVYPPENRFSVAIAHRVTADAPPVLTRETAFHPRTSALTRSFVEYRGYWLPHCFNNEGAIAEYWACRERVAVIDLSPLRKWEILGPDAEALMQRTITRNARKLSVGQVVYTAMCNETGGMIDDATVFRLGQDNFRFVGGDEYDGVWLGEVAEREGMRAFVKPSTDQLHNLAVQGPDSRRTLAQIVWTPPTQPGLEELKWFRFLIGRIGGYDGIPIIVSRTGYTGELGYEVWCHPSDGPAVWDAVWAAGAPYGIKPLGLEALDILRIESGLIFAGYEFDDQVDPCEAGIPFVIALGDEDFIGREALLERKQHPQRTLVGLVLEGNEPAGHGDEVYVGRRRVGVVTSGTRSPALKRPVALCRIAVQYAELGTRLEIGKLDGLQKRIAATVVRFPFYDPDKTRPRS
ncbi:MAG: aminomethyltransferase family protein [Solirubrobacterales bacterium]|nr:aminomethyltransferase family protein [Solirubrobacterales bacterium]MBV9716317.1 aminomethyltransferase family protein [Solirubrobacterales bacterium]